MTSKNQDNIINEVFEGVRDAASMETNRAIQDSEGHVAQEMKKMVKILVGKGWPKNEIIYEM